MYQKDNMLTIEERKWNLMWDMWVEGSAVSPYAELMQYDSEVNNGGHFQYFINGTLMGDMNEQIGILLENLPELLRDNLKHAYDVFCGLQRQCGMGDDYDAYSALEDMCDPEKVEKFIEYDKLLYDNEDAIMNILKEYANALSLNL